MVQTGTLDIPHAVQGVSAVFHKGHHGVDDGHEPCQGMLAPMRGEHRPPWKHTTTCSADPAIFATAHICMNCMLCRSALCQQRPMCWRCFEALQVHRCCHPERLSLECPTHVMVMQGRLPGSGRRVAIRGTPALVSTKKCLRCVRHSALCSSCCSTSAAAWVAALPREVAPEAARCMADACTPAQ